MGQETSKNNNGHSAGRRGFLEILIGGSLTAWLAAIIYPVFQYLVPPKSEEAKVSNVKACKVSDMEKDSGKIIKFGSKPVILIRSSAGDFKAFSAECTHLDCIVQYRKDYGQIYCACHNGRYDLNGRNVSGPPPAPLTKFGVAIKGEDVFVFREES